MEQCASELLSIFQRKSSHKRSEASSFTEDSNSYDPGQVTFSREVSPKKLPPLDVVSEKSNMSSPTPSMLRFESQKSSQVSFNLNFNTEADANSLQCTPVKQDDIDAAFFNANPLEKQFSSASS